MRRPAAPKAATQSSSSPKRTKGTISSQEASSTLLLGVSTSSSGGRNSLSANEVKNAIERGDVSVRVKALEYLIQQHVNGESQNHMIMPIIKYIVPLDDHYIKKLVFYFWEVVDKTDADGNLLSEIILICSFLRGDLLHPNEYVRGITLRFLCKLHERDLLEPLVSAVVQNLTHNVTYVRRHAVLAVDHIYRLFPDLLPDAIDLMEACIETETDMSARRNAFDMMRRASPERAAVFLANFCEHHSLSSAGSEFLMSVVDFCHEQIRANALEKARYVPVLFAVLQNSNDAVRYQCASTLLSLSSSPTAITQAALTYIDLLKSCNDNTVRLIVLHQVSQMKLKHASVLQQSLPDILSILHQDGPTETRRCVWRLATDLVSRQTVEHFVATARKELQEVSSHVSSEQSMFHNHQQQLQTNASLAPAQGASAGAGGAPAPATLCSWELYRLDLLHALQVAVGRFPDVVGDTVAMTITDYILGVPLQLQYAGSSGSREGSSGGEDIAGSGKANGGSGAVPIPGEASNLELVRLLKELLQLRPSIRTAAVRRLWENFSRFTQLDVLRVSLWIFSAFVTEADTAVEILSGLRDSLQPLPLTPPSAFAASSGNAGDAGVASRSGLRATTTVAEDGTYVTSYVEADAPGSGDVAAGEAGDANCRSTLYSFVQHGCGAIISSLATSLVRLAHVATSGKKSSSSSTAINDVSELLLECLRYSAVVEGTPYSVEDDAQEQLRLSLTMVSSSATSSLSQAIWQDTLQLSLKAVRNPYAAKPAATAESATHAIGAAAGIAASSSSLRASFQPDAPLLFSQLSAGGSGEDVTAAAYDMEVMADVAAETSVDDNRRFLRHLEEVHPLSGYFDPIYVEARVSVEEFDVSVEWRLINCTPHHLTQVMVDLTSLGGMKVCERAQVHSLGPAETLTMRTSLKVGSTESGVIFGTLLFDFPDGSHNCMVLNNIDVDVMNYIKPAAMSNVEFRRKWRSLDWENKITVSTTLKDMAAYVDLVKKELNMRECTSSSSSHGPEPTEEEVEKVEEEEIPIGGCLSCNLCARTAFGEDVLTNISIESDEDGTISGIVRIRSGTHTLAYGVGKKLNVVHGDYSATRVGGGGH